MSGRQRRPGLVDSEEVAAFFAKLDHLNQAQLMSMRAAWRATSREVHEDAWTTVRAVCARDGLTAEIDRVRNRALAWTTRGSNSVPFFRENFDYVDWQQAKMEAGEAIVDAALAVALGSRLDAPARDVLIGPWLRATEAVE
jgi:hypothetical protein